MGTVSDFIASLGLFVPVLIVVVVVVYLVIINDPDINSQLISHGFAVPPGLSQDGLSTADAENVTKCLLSMLSQRVVSVVVLYRWVAAKRGLVLQEDTTRAEEMTTKLCTLSYDHERLRTIHGAATGTAENAEREAEAARAKLT